MLVWPSLILEFVPNTAPAQTSSDSEGIRELTLRGITRAAPAILLVTLALSACSMTERFSGLMGRPTTAVAPMPPPPTVVAQPGIAATPTAAGTVPDMAVPAPRPAATPPAAQVAQAAPAAITPPAPQAAAARPAPAALVVTGPAPVNDVLVREAQLDNTELGRIRRLEAGLAQMQQQFDTLKPTIERLVAIEGDLNELVSQLFKLADQPAASPAPPAAAARAVTTAPAPAGGAPLSILPPGAQRPPAQVAAATQPAAAAPAAPVAAAAAALATPAAGNSFALHLASYRQIATAQAGWQELLKAMPTALSGLKPNTSVFENGAAGKYYRLEAGPIASRTDADNRCKTIKATGQFCTVVSFAGATPF